MTQTPAFPDNIEELRRYLEVDGSAKLPGTLGVEILEMEPGRCRTRIEIGTRHLAPNGYLHAAAIIGLADTSCGYGTFTDLPNGAENFTTLELKSNFLGTAREAQIVERGASATPAEALEVGRVDQFARNVQAIPMHNIAPHILPVIR